MKIGINASFLRKPGTGIGQVTNNVLRTLISNTQYLIPNTHEFFIYCEEVPELDFELPENFEMKSFLPKWWKRDDVPRKWLWERELAERAAADGCDAFLSLYQSATVFSEQGTANREQSTRVKHVMIVHDIIPELFPEYLAKVSQKIYWTSVKEGIRHADQIIAISEATKNDLTERLALPAEKISIVHPDVSPRFHETLSDAAVSAVLEKYDLERGYIYHGGGLEVRKNAEGVLRAYKSLCDKFQNKPESLNFKIPKLVISGKIYAKSNKLATDVERLIEELDLSEHVRLLGFVPDEDLPALYRGALCFAYPSLYEGFGLPVLEALSLGTPVLVSEVSSLPEVAGHAALYCNPESIDSIAAGMERLITDAALRETLISRSAPQAALFSWERFTQTIIEASL